MASARGASSSSELPGALGGDEVFVSVAPELGDALAAVLPDVLVDARMRKRAQPEAQRGLAPLTIGLGPNFVAGETTDLAIETQWGDALGAVVTRGPTKPLGGEPRAFEGHARDRFVYAPVGGVLRTRAAIAQRVAGGGDGGDDRRRAAARAAGGILRGLVHDGVPVAAGAKVIEVDPRGDLSKVLGIGPRPRRIAEGVLEAMARGAT